MATMKHCVMHHETGTKFYQVLLLQGAGSLGVNIRRWGKIGTSGQTKVISGTEATRDYVTIVLQKMKRGYRPIVPDDGRPIHIPNHMIAADRHIKLLRRLDVTYNALIDSFMMDEIARESPTLDEEYPASTPVKLIDHSATDPEWGTW